MCKKALTRVSGAQVGLFDEKTGGRKSRDTVPLTKTKQKYGSYAGIIHTVTEPHYFDEAINPGKRLQMVL
jgi:hypothetical protein